uniref:Uncharacterized protein n=1 Tax=Chlamydomonas leiostraca TaxID=1034604 RepID=A0A7S0RH74_9CHLO
MLLSSMSGQRMTGGCSCSRPTAPARGLVAVRADFKLSAIGGPTPQRQTIVSVGQSSAPPPPANGTIIPAVAAGGIFLFGMVKYIQKKRQGSLHGLEERGYLDQNRFRKDPFMSDVMKNVNTVPMPALSDEQIAAARARRQKERANHKITLEDIELPENHPWATKAPVSKDDDQRVRARIRLQRGVPPPPASPAGSADGDSGDARPRPRTRGIEAPNSRSSKL